MCGIIFVKSADGTKTRQMAQFQFLHQKSRGVSGFGVYEPTKDVTHRDTDKDGFFKSLAKTEDNVLLVHHRIPTSTANTIRATHPFHVTAGDRTFSVIHNGVISNHAEVLKKLGVKPEDLASYDPEAKTYNDSEALALDFVDALTTGRKELHSVGTMAILCVERGANMLYAYRNTGNPLEFYTDGDLVVAASTAPIDPELSYDVKAGTLFKFKYDDPKAVLTVERALESTTYVANVRSVNDYRDYTHKHNAPKQLPAASGELSDRRIETIKRVINFSFREKFPEDSACAFITSDKEVTDELYYEAIQKVPDDLSDPFLARLIASNIERRKTIIAQILPFVANDKKFRCDGSLAKFLKRRLEQLNAASTVCSNALSV